MLVLSAPGISQAVFTKVTATRRSRWEARTDSEPRANPISALSGKLAESNTMKHYCWWSQILAYSLLLMHTLVVTLARTRCYCHMLSLSLSCAEPDGKQGKEEKTEPEANFALSGKLAAESNTVKGVVLVHQEPPEARKPSQMWRLYGFKNGEPSLFLLLLFPLLLLLLLSSSSSSSCSSLLLLLSFFCLLLRLPLHAARSDLYGRWVEAEPNAAQSHVVMVSDCFLSASWQELQAS